MPLDCGAVTDAEALNEHFWSFACVNERVASTASMRRHFKDAASGMVRIGELGRETSGMFYVFKSVRR